MGAQSAIEGGTKNLDNFSNEVSFNHIKIVTVDVYLKENQVSKNDNNVCVDHYSLKTTYNTFKNETDSPSKELISLVSKTKEEFDDFFNNKLIKFSTPFDLPQNDSNEMEEKLEKVTNYFNKSIKEYNSGKKKLRTSELRNDIFLILDFLEIRHSKIVDDIEKIKSSIPPLGVEPLVEEKKETECNIFQTFAQLVTKHEIFYPVLVFPKKCKGLKKEMKGALRKKNENIFFFYVSTLSKKICFINLYSKKCVFFQEKEDLSETNEFIFKEIPDDPLKSNLTITRGKKEIVCEIEISIKNSVKEILKMLSYDMVALPEHQKKKKSAGGILASTRSTGVRDLIGKPFREFTSTFVSAEYFKYKYPKLFSQFEKIFKINTETKNLLKVVYQKKFEKSSDSRRVNQPMFELLQRIHELSFHRKNLFFWRKADFIDWLSKIYISELDYFEKKSKSLKKYLGDYINTIDDDYGFPYKVRMELEKESYKEKEIEIDSLHVKKLLAHLNYIIPKDNSLGVDYCEDRLTQYMLFPKLKKFLVRFELYFRKIEKEVNNRKISVPQFKEFLKGGLFFILPKWKSINLHIRLFLEDLPDPNVAIVSPLVIKKFKCYYFADVKNRQSERFMKRSLTKKVKDLCKTSVRARNSNDFYEVEVKLMLTCIDANFMSQTINIVGSKLIMKNYGKYHAAVMIKGCQIDWNNNSLVRIKSAQNKKTACCYDVQKIFLPCSRKEGSGEDFEMFISKVCDFFLDWNMNHHYDVMKNSCHEFVDEFLKMLGIEKLKEHQKGFSRCVKTMEDKKFLLSKKFKSDFGINIKGGSVVFENHNRLKKFMQIFDTEVRFADLMVNHRDEYSLLKSLDRSFYLKTREVLDDDSDDEGEGEDEIEEDDNLFNKYSSNHYKNYLGVGKIDGGWN